MATPFPLGRLLELLDQLSDAVSLHTADCTILFANAALARSLGYDAADFVGVDSFATVHRDDVDRVRQVFLAVAAGETTYGPTQYRVPSRAGEWTWVESVATSYLDDPAIGAIVVTSRNVDARVKAEQRLRLDPLTGLPNRLDALEHLESTVVNGLLLVDLDGFKTVNAIAGSLFADEALRVSAERLRALAPGAYVARVGGDEFLVLPVDEDAMEVAARVRVGLAEVIGFDGRRLQPSASVGVVVAGPDATADALLADAGTAVRDAKERGGDLVVPFDDRLRARLHRWVNLRDELRRATDEASFALAYQPIVCLPSGGVHGAEALLRPGEGRSWTAGEAIRVAEDSGLIVPIGRWVLDAALVALAGVGSTAALSVNVSPRQLTDPGFVDGVRAALEQHLLSPSAIGFEITESLAVADIDGTITALRALRDLGCHIGLDDFGTGQSSLSYLRRLPVDYVKIDRSFVEPLDVDPAARSMVEAMIAMCDALHLDVIAEGVERATQRDILVEAGCRYGQGYLLGKPGASIPLPRTHRCTPTEHSNLHHGPLVIDLVARRAMVRGEDRNLTRLELDLLARLASAPGRVFSRAELLQLVWGSEPGWQGLATITEHVSRIRSKIEDDARSPRWVQTVRSIGYRFDPGPWG